ncbi:MAG: hypothetical protein K0Q55_524 [Verrucomicrobia bacterium]|nr:hypothetical protein [Verrucomicrobiota bacterium]
MIFHVEAAGEFRPVELAFATEAEVRRVRAWRKRTPGTDAGEFAALAAKRWFYYTREGASVGSLDELRNAIEKNERAELAFLLVASAHWSKRYKFLALAYCRRTWCHHLVLDFLAVRPGLSFANEPISGVGSGVLASLMGIADSLGMETMWGEATASSAPFYEKVLRVRPVKDSFMVHRAAMQEMARTYFTNQKHRLANAEEIEQVHPDESGSSKKT